MSSDESTPLGRERDYIPDGTLKAYRHMVKWWTDEQTDEEGEPDQRKHLCALFIRYMDEVRNEDGSPGLSRQDVRDAREILEARGGEIAAESTAPAPLRALDIVHDRKDRTRVSLALDGEIIDYIDAFGEGNGLTRAESIQVIVRLYQEYHDDPGGE